MLVVIFVITATVQTHRQKGLQKQDLFLTRFLISSAWHNNSNDEIFTVINTIIKCVHSQNSRIYSVREYLLWRGVE